MNSSQSIITASGKLEIGRLLGKGKSGYSYMAFDSQNRYVLKLMHYEECKYYNFGNANKVDIEVNSYQVLSNLGLPVPRLLDCNRDKNYLLKEYIDGVTATELIAGDNLSESCMVQLFDMFSIASRNCINIDYFPSNFILSDEKLYYIDYEHNNYDPKWNLPNWGLFYWINCEGMRKYLQTNDLIYLNEDYNSGIPIKQPFYEKIKILIDKFHHL